MTEQEGASRPARTAGKRSGARKGARPPRRVNSAALSYGLAIVLAVVAWGYLVWAAIDFGSQARDGDGRAWWFLALAALGAVACLFVGLMLAARLLRAFGQPTGHTPIPRAGGGKRAAR
ncbi:hypothetical protein [Nocardioides sp. AN3]